MWLLDAWKNAEKITYPVVWEEIKDADNVIDYNIHDEITKDTSNVINANNDTTTGMANVIPWVNAPKLIASTSIIWLKESEPWTLQATATIPYYHYFAWAQSYDEDITSFTLSWEIWTDHLTQTAGWLEIPLTWTYLLQIEYEWITWQMNCTDNIVVNWTTIHSFVSSYSTYWTTNPTEQLFIILNKWDILSWNIQSQHTTTSAFGFNHTVTIKFTKL